MEATIYNPNPSYYDKKGGIRHEFWDKGSNVKLAEMGMRNNLSCGDHWILGADFAFLIEFAASGYDHMAFVREFGIKTTEKWHEMRQHLLMVARNWHTLKSRDEVAFDIGIMVEEAA